MSGILDSFSSMISPDTTQKLSKTLGVDSSVISKGLAAVGPLVLGSLAKRASTPDGASSLLNALPQETGGGFLSNLIGSIKGAGSQANLMNSLLGSGVNAMGSTLSQKLGFNVRPLLALATPTIAGFIGNLVKKDNINPQGLASLLKNETETFTKDPRNRETNELVNSALDAADKATTLRNKFDDSQWMKLRTAPMAAMYVVAVSSPSGPIGLFQEIDAASDAVIDSIKDVSPTSVVGSAFGGGLSKEEVEQIKKDSPSKESALNSIKEGVRVVSQTSPADLPAYRQLILNVAQKVAEATKEGGFLGIGGTRVSKEEEQAIASIRAVIE
jgi:Bacterial protein of unknown function (DUF937)